CFDALRTQVLLRPVQVDDLPCHGVQDVPVPGLVDPGQRVRRQRRRDFDEALITHRDEDAVRVRELRLTLVDWPSTERFDVDLLRLRNVRYNGGDPAKPLDAQRVVLGPPSWVVAWLESWVITGRPPFQQLPFDELERTHRVFGVRIQDRRP